jgi:hypothetical protein
MSNLGGSRLMGLRDFLLHRVSEQLTALTDGRISHDRDLVQAAPQEKIEFDFAILEIIQNLICGTFATVFAREKFLHIVDRRSLRHPSVLSFRKRAASRTRPRFPGAAVFARASAEDKGQSRRCGGA